MKSFLHLLPRFGLLFTLATAQIVFPASSGWISATLIAASPAMVLSFILNQHLLMYRLGKTSRIHFLRNLLLDVLDLLLAIAAATYLGGFAGTRLSLSYGLWAGWFAGMLSAFLAAWFMRMVWKKVSAILLA
jgi:hypothetical protein